MNGQGYNLFFVVRFGALIMSPKGNERYNLFSIVRFVVLIMPQNGNETY